MTFQDSKTFEKMVCLREKSAWSKDNLFGEKLKVLYSSHTKFAHLKK